MPCQNLIKVRSLHFAFVILDIILVISLTHVHSTGDIRLKLFKQRIPREEIEAVWSIIGFASCCTTTTQSKPDIKNVELLLSALLFYDCGTLSSSQIHEKLPPSKLQVDTCSKEIKWICSLLSSKLLGEVPKMDKLDKQVIQRVVRLEAFVQILDLIPTSSTSKVNKTVKQLWGYSCITESSTKLESNLQSSLMNLDISCLTNSTNNVYSLLSNSVLLRECVSFTAIYDNMVMKKNPVWNGFRTNKLSPLIEMFVKEAVVIESDLEKNRSGESSVDDEFAAMFRCIELATEIRIMESPASSHYREAACHLLLVSVLARSKNNSPGKGFNLNTSFIEKVRYLFIHAMCWLVQTVLLTHFCYRLLNTRQTTRCVAIKSIILIRLPETCRLRMNHLAPTTFVSCILHRKYWHIHHYCTSMSLTSIRRIMKVQPSSCVII